MTQFPAQFVADQSQYQVDSRTMALLKESAPLMIEWSTTACEGKSTGGMEEWAKTHHKEHPAISCDWYHSTWQLLRIINLVATPPWYPFYNRALAGVLSRKPNATVLISAAADWGMLAQLHEAIELAGAHPKIFLYDICKTPLIASEWYAERHGFTIECVRDNIITSQDMPLGAFDLIVTDEFLTVLKSEYKPQIAQRWKELLKPGGTLVTTAMIGGPTTPDLRDLFAANAIRRMDAAPKLFDNMGISRAELVARFEHFAKVHTRHMLTSPEQLEALFEGYRLNWSRVVTPGECVNPTNSYQIVAQTPD